MRGCLEMGQFFVFICPVGSNQSDFCRVDGSTLSIVISNSICGKLDRRISDIDSCSGTNLSFSSMDGFYRQP
jgi:hypothetical protein